ncbi:conserved hypothetical protein [Microbacterium sp. 8M]|uniref:DUF3349 domain-containing protein n=1 Tax=Microbacterium sp. 8M TaxID=2653153 RepID=UPI0012F3D066|nr:DUF3349 domain-containing protein [Microbacterium sp. 8M]VXB86546.1 conserved hypothetical protein [Microbacterium sp. 8M]
MNGNVLTRVLDWLRAGYPEGVPPKDYSPLLALLQRTLTAEELAAVVSALAQQETDPVRVSQIRTAIADVTSATPGEDEVRRVAAHLAERGVPLSTKAQRIAGDRRVLAEAESEAAASGAAGSGAADAAGSAGTGVPDAVGTGVAPDADPSPIAQALRWLGAGYPDGIPAQDRVPILALLRRRLTDDEVQEVCEAVAAQSGADPEVSIVDAQVLMMKVLGELPGDDDVERVRARLEESGFTLS